MYTLDPNVIIAYDRRDPRVVPVLRERLRNPTSSIDVSTMTAAELCSCANLREEEKDFVEAIWQPISLLPPLSQVARIAGSLRDPRDQIGRCVYRCHGSLCRKHGAHQHRA